MTRRFPRIAFRACLSVMLVAAMPQHSRADSQDNTTAALPAREDVSPPPHESTLASFADPAALWGEGVEAVIERAYRECFRTYIIDGRVMTVRMPFAQNNEREELSGTELEIIGKGKADPEVLWDQIDAILGSPDFLDYVAVLRDGREKVMVFDLPSRRWSVSRELFDIAGMKAGAYRGMPYRPYVLSYGGGVRGTDVYNYLYSVGRIGLDCSGFVWHVLSYTARAGGVDLGQALARVLGVEDGNDPSFYVGTSFFDSKSREVIQVEDQVGNIRPGDVFLFRGHDGRAAHSAVVQSVDPAAGVIRYLQCTDEAPPDQRGVHESYIHFDPTKPEVSLKDSSVEWTQGRYAPFPGERPSAFSNDGERFRAYPGFGGGKVVRLKAMSAALRSISGEDDR